MVPAEPTHKNLHRNLTVNHRSVFMSCTYCSETFQSPPEQVSNVTNLRQLWQSPSYTLTLAAGFTAWNLLPFLGPEVETKLVAEEACLQGKHS